MSTHAESIRMQRGICAGPERGSSVQYLGLEPLVPALPLYFSLSNHLVKYKTNPGSKDCA